MVQSGAMEQLQCDSLAALVIDGTVDHAHAARIGSCFDLETVAHQTEVGLGVARLLVDLPELRDHRVIEMWRVGTSRHQLGRVGGRRHEVLRTPRKPSYFSR